MPGAFTTTCTQVHLPGYVQSAKKLRSLGIDTIAVITTNDRFVNQEWSKQQGLVSSNTDSPPITILCDADGDFIKGIGLADDMGFGIGVRSKRFAMITDNGVVTTLLTDDGMDDCKVTSVENVIKLLTPEPVPGSSDGAIEIDGKLIAGVIVAITIAVFASMMGGNDAPTKTGPAQSPTQSNVMPKSRGATNTASDSNFPLIDEYLKK
jgi:glutaredoxin/glutathione-dependent peroxiredoxin